ncbi:MAG: Tol-Pal system beta propeller repeat protein TolB [Syntrophobacteraceae bacterium]
MLCARNSVLKWGFILSAFWLFWIWNSPVYGVIDLTITGPGFQRVPIAIPNFKYLSPEQPQLAREMGEALANALDNSGVFNPLDPKGFLEDPQTMGVNVGEIKFPDWRRLGADYLVRAVYQVQGSSIKFEARLFETGGARMVIGKVYEGETRNWLAMVNRFADEILFAVTGERGVFDTKICYVQAQGKGKEIFVVDFDGSNPVQVTRDQSITLSPAWNSDASQIAYVSYKDGSPKIYSMSAMDGSQRLVAGYPGLNISPAWRPGTSQLAVTLSKGGNQDIYLISSSGEILQKLVQSWAINVSPAWSPDGKRLAFVSSETGNPQIYVLDVGSGRKNRISFSSGNYCTSPSWSPKGDWIAYNGLVGGRHNIFIVRPNGGEVHQLTHGEGDNEDPTWSPDGRMLAFSSTREGGSAIWVMPANGGAPRRLTRQGSGQQLPDWSPRLSSRQ